MVYLIEKQRIPSTALENVLTAISDPEGCPSAVQLDHRIVLKMKDILREKKPDLPDRVVAATAQYYGVPS